MNLRNSIVLAKLVILCLGCSNESSSSREKDSVQASSPTPDSISRAGKPSQQDTAAFDPLGLIEGCACYYAESKAQFAKNDFVFMSDMDSTAYLIVQQQPSRLKLVSTTQEPGNFATKQHTEIYSNDKYSVTIEVQQNERTGEETWGVEATLSIQEKGKTVQKRKLTGECGC